MGDKLTQQNAKLTNEVETLKSNHQYENSSDENIIQPNITNKNISKDSDVDEYIASVKAIIEDLNDQLHSHNATNIHESEGPTSSRNLQNSDAEMGSNDVDDEQPSTSMNAKNKNNQTKKRYDTIESDEESEDSSEASEVSQDEDSEDSEDNGNDSEEN